MTGLNSGQWEFIAQQQGLPGPKANQTKIDWTSIIQAGIGSVDDIISASSGRYPSGTYSGGYPYPHQERTNNTALIAGGAFILIIAVLLISKK